MGSDLVPNPAQPLSDQAINWLLLLRSGRATQHDYACFLAWREASPLHESAWQQLTGTLGGATFGRLGDAYPLGYAACPRSPPPAAGMRPLSRRRFLAGGALLAASGLAGTYVGNLFYPLVNFTADAATSTGKRRRYRLSDNSELLLDARSRLNLAFTTNYRKLHLLDGAVSITATSNTARPIIVQTAEGVVRSPGTHYMVRQQPHRTLVIAHADPVEIETLAGTRTVLPPGMGVRFDAVRIGPPRTDLVAEAAWVGGLIEAQGRPLGEIVAALRPYHPGSLRVSMAAGGLPVSGRYPLDQPAAALAALERKLPIQVRRLTPWFVSIDVLAT